MATTTVIVRANSYQWGEDREKSKQESNVQRISQPGGCNFLTVNVHFRTSGLECLFSVLFFSPLFSIQLCLSLKIFKRICIF